MRCQARVFYVQPLATNQSDAPGGAGEWRTLWTDRLLRFDAVMQAHLRDLVDVVVPALAITAAWPNPPSADPHQYFKYKALFTVLMNYALWGAKRAPRCLGHASSAASADTAPRSA